MRRFFKSSAMGLLVFLTLTGFPLVCGICVFLYLYSDDHKTEVDKDFRAMLSRLKREWDKVHPTVKQKGE